MNEAQPRATAKRDNHSVNDPVYRRVCRRQRLINDRTVLKIVRVILAPIPGHTRALGVLTVQAAHASSLASAQLLKTQLRHVLARKTHQIHVASNG